MKTLRTLAVVLLITGPALVATPAQAAPTLTMLGADVSSLKRSLDLGARYYDAAGTARDPIDILKTAGVNYARLRVWNSTASGYNDKAAVLTHARTLKAKGLKILIDFHYSDTWADPGHQVKPAAWTSHSLSRLGQDVYAHTYDVCTSLKAQGTTPDSVQIGNEINVGMLWPDGLVTNQNFAPLAGLLKQAYAAIKACDSAIPVLIHTAWADSMVKARWLYDGIKAQGVQWDITALSYYCMWHGTLANLAKVIKDMRARYAKPVVIVETAYPFTTGNADSQTNVVAPGVRCDGLPASPQGQAEQFTQVQNTSRSAGAIGVFYWEPTWYAVPGNGWDPADINGTGNLWDNMTVFDWTGRMNPTVRWLP